MELKIEISKIPLKNEKLEALVVFVAEGTDLTGSGLRDLPDELKKQLSTSLKLRVFNGKKGSSQHFVSSYAKIPQMLAIGVGKKDELDAETLRRAAGKAGKIITDDQFDRACVNPKHLVDVRMFMRALEDILIDDEWDADNS